MVRKSQDLQVFEYDEKHHRLSYGEGGPRRRIQHSPRKGLRRGSSVQNFDEGGRDVATNPGEDILRRLKKFGMPANPPELELKDPPCARIRAAVLSDERSMMAMVRPLLAQAKNHLGNFTLVHLALSSSISTFLELAPGLYVERERHLVVTVPCEGSPRPGGRRGERIDCMGRAAIELDFDESERREDVAYRLEQSRVAFSEAVERLRKPLSREFSAAILYLDNLVEYILERHAASTTVAINDYERDLFGRLGLHLFYHLASCRELLTDDLPSTCPALAHSLGQWLEDLGSALVKPDPAQCLPVLKAMAERPAAHRFLMGGFDPNVPGLGSAERAEAYRMIQEIPDAESHFAFSLLSKVW